MLALAAAAADRHAAAIPLGENPRMSEKGTVIVSTANLPVIETCDGCAACCLPQGAPPDFVALRLNPHFAEDPSFAEDVAILARLPEEARRLLDEYLAATAAGRIRRDGPCVWLDPTRPGCRFYEFRPSTCRVFERNSPGCHYYRREQSR